MVGPGRLITQVGGWGDRGRWAGRRVTSWIDESCKLTLVPRVGPRGLVMFSGVRIWDTSRVGTKKELIIGIGLKKELMGTWILSVLGTRLRESLSF